MLTQRRISRWGLGWRITVGCLGFLALLNGSIAVDGSVTAKEQLWPLGPLSQYAFRPPASDSIQITKVEGATADGNRFDLPLRNAESGIARSEVEARTDDIEKDPALLQSVADGWMQRHPQSPRLVQVWLVQYVTPVDRGRRGTTLLVELATWKLS